MMKNIFSNWTMVRALYFIAGVLIMLHGSIDNQWIGLLLGAWPAAMGLFGLGCATGNSSSGKCEVQPVRVHRK